MARMPASLSLLLCVLGRTVPTAAPATEAGHQGTCYRVLHERLTFLEAHAACAQWGGRLPQVHREATWNTLRRQLRGAHRWWVVRAGAEPLAAGIFPHLQGTRQHPTTCTFLSSQAGLLQKATGATCHGRHPVLCRFGPVEGGGCPSREARSTALGTEWKQEAHLEAAFPITSQGRRPQRLTWWQWRPLGERQPFPEAAEIWEALQSIAPGRWRQELLQRLLEPVREDGIWSTPELAEEMGLFQAVSKHLLQEGAWPAPHWDVLSTLAAHGASRLLQISLGPCSPRTAGDTQREALAGAMMQILHNLEQAVRDKESGRPLVLETPLISISVHRASSSDVGKMLLSFPGSPPGAASVVLPDQSAVDTLIPRDTPLDVQKCWMLLLVGLDSKHLMRISEMVSFLGSPLLSGMARTVTGTVAELNVLSGGAEIRISNLSAPVQIFLPQTTAAVFAPAVHISSGEALLLRVNVTQAEGSLLIYAIPEPEEPLELFLQSPHLPDAAAEPRAEQGGYSWLVGQEVFSALEGEPRFLMVPSNLSATEPVALRVSTYGIQCVSWHLSSAQWRDEGCTVGHQSSLAQGHCLCSHLSFFGSSFWVVPVQVDVVRTAEYFGRVTKNPVLVLLLGALYALYLLGVAWARWMDVRDRPQVRPAVLASDDPCARYCYVLRIGLPRPQSPGVIGLYLRGSGSDSKAHQLPTGTSTFLLREPWPLGELQSIWLWQECSQERRPQYVAEATVVDPQRRTCVHFPCNAWLVPAEDGPSTPQGFLAAPQQQHTTFWAIFRQRTLRGLREEHTLLVVLRPPAHTHFTRVQRLSCGWCLLLCSALISLVFWEVPHEESPQLLRLGSFSLSWKDIMVGIESALMTFPVNLLVVFIFRHTKPRKSCGSSQASVKPSAPTSPSSLENVLQSLRTAVQALSTARTLPELAVLQESWSPEVDLDRLLQLLAPFVRGNREAEEERPAVDPRRPSAGPSPDSLHQAYCVRYLVLKLKHVARLLEELESGAEVLRSQALQQVHETAKLLAKRLPAGLSSSPRPRWSLPWWALLVGWALLVSLSAVSTFFILLYGFQYGKESSVRWLVSTAISLGQSIFLLQPCKVVACAVLCALILKKTDGDDEMAFDLEG